MRTTLATGVAVVLALTIAGVTVAAYDFSRTWFEVAIRTGEPLDIVYDRAAGLTLAHDVPPGAKVNVDNPGEPRCTEHDVDPSLCASLATAGGTSLHRPLGVDSIVA